MPRGLAQRRWIRAKLIGLRHKSGKQAFYEGAVQAVLVPIDKDLGSVAQNNREFEREAAFDVFGHYQFNLHRSHLHSGEGLRQHLEHRFVSASTFGTDQLTCQKV